MCLAMLHGVGRQQQQGATLTAAVYAAAAARLMTTICLSKMIRAHQATDAAETDSASSLTVSQCHHDRVSSHFYQNA